MSIEPHIVCFGLDEILLETRRKVLATRFDASVVTSLKALGQTIASEHIALLVLCHTLPEQERAAALAMAGTGSHAIEVLLMVSSCAHAHGSTQAIRTTEGHQQLLNKISEMVTAMANARSYMGIATMLSLSHPGLPLVEESRREVVQSKRHMYHSRI